MRKAKCIDCGRSAERITCNSCTNIISVCVSHRNDYFPVENESEVVCVDCANVGVGGMQRQIEKRFLG